MRQGLAGGERRRLMRRLGIRADPQRRTVDEAAIIDLLLTLGWVAEVKRGDRASAEDQARRTLDRLVGLGLQFEQSALGQRCFDPAEVANFAESLSLERLDPFWSDRCVPMSREFVWAAHGRPPTAEAPPSPTALPPRRFTVCFRRRFNLDGRVPGTRIRLRLPLPIEDETLGDVELRLDPSPQGDVDFTVAEARLEAQVTIPASLTVELGFEVSFTASPTGHSQAPASLDPQSAALYTRPNEDFIRLSDPVRQLAAEIAGSQTDTWTQLERFWNFIFDRLTFGIINYDEIDLARPTEWIVRNGWCDCQLASALMVAFCRARDIPSRMIGGYVLDPGAPYHHYHYWLEAWIPGRGWTPFDTLSWLMSGGGRDRHWRDYYLGQVDYRMKTERLPRLFSGAGAIRLPRAWYRLSKLNGQGLDLDFRARDTGALIYRDHIAITGADPLLSDGTA
jgi:hypothetical protein